MVIFERLIPNKRIFRARAHVNPLNQPFFPYPRNYHYINWKQHFPKFFGGDQKDNHKIYCNTERFPSNYGQFNNKDHRKIDFIDIGCGYGGLLFALGPLFPQKLIFGLQIREPLVNYVGQKIKGYRIMHPNQFNNISVTRANTMRHLCHYFPKESLQKIFICFPDPHFKSKQFKRRIINTGFLSQYAYLLKPEGRLYCITDVQELCKWHLEHLQGHSQFQKVKDDSDPCIQIILNKTEEGIRVGKNNGQKYWAIFSKKVF